MTCKIYAVNNHHKICKKAFTLAEVLITLGIIGVVAALTIPALINTINDIQYKAGAKKAYSIASQALTQLKANKGEDLSYYVNTARSFKPDYMKFFKVSKDCNLYDCVDMTSSSSIYKADNGVNAATWYMGDGQFISIDGIFWAFDNNVSRTTLLITIDSNGYLKGPNIFGKDVVSFEIYNNQLIPSGSTNSTYTQSGFCGSGTWNAYSGIGCTYKLLNGA